MRDEILGGEGGWVDGWVVVVFLPNWPLTRRLYGEMLGRFVVKAVPGAGRHNPSLWGGDWP